MDEEAGSQPINLFTLRLWQEPIGESRCEWRGELKHLATGNVRYFRRWDEIRGLVLGMLDGESER